MERRVKLKGRRNSGVYLGSLTALTPDGGISGEAVTALTGGGDAVRPSSSHSPGRDL
eukprot:COSAG02_NODE_86_length_39084_cov_17.815724_2_plen_57_part_00